MSNETKGDMNQNYVSDAHDLDHVVMENKWIPNRRERPRLHNREIWRIAGIILRAVRRNYPIQHRLQTVLYVNLGQTNRDIEQLGQYIAHINQLCHATEIQNWTDCSHFNILSEETFKRIKGSENLLRELIGDNPRMKRRGALNFVGEICKILFGTLDADDANYYNEQIKHLEESSEDLTNLMKQQLSIVKASLGTFNETISDLEYNSQVTKNGLIKLKSYMERILTNTESQLNLVDLKITAEDHIPQVNSTLSAMQINLDLIIESVINAQKGILQPQIVAPSLVSEILKGSISAFPKETMAPFIIGKESAHLLYKICDINIYVKMVFWDILLACR
jgi:hypothetical protein